MVPSPLLQKSCRLAYAAVGAPASLLTDRPLSRPPATTSVSRKNKEEEENALSSSPFFFTSLSPLFASNRSIPTPLLLRTSHRVSSDARYRRFSLQVLEPSSRSGTHRNLIERFSFDVKASLEESERSFRSHSLGTWKTPMWPLHLLANKILKLDDADDHIGGVEFAVLTDDDDENDGVGKGGFPPVDRPRSRFVDVPHVRQLRNWDCGLACALMVLRTLGVDGCDIRDLGALCPTTSIWTIDLAYLLHKFSVTFSFFTVTLGANPDFSAEAFYKEQLQDDLRRVDTLFAKAVEVGIDIQCRSISGKDISSLILSGNYIAVALVDKYKLSHSWLEDIYFSGCYSSSLDYIGHYIVVCGYDQDTEQFEIRDPACSRKHERVSLKCLEEARTSFGTDEDILLICLNGYEG